MQGTQTVSSSKQLQNSQEFINAAQYSAFLRVTKPLIDVSKRSNIAQHFQYNNALISEQLNIEVDSVINSHISMIFKKLRDEQHSLIKTFNTDGKFRTAIENALSSLGYVTSAIDNDSFIVDKASANALVRCGCTLNITGLFDSDWEYRSIVELSNARIHSDCDAGIYISLGKISTDLRELSKKLDIFVLSGWEVLRLLHDTGVVLSAIFEGTALSRRAK